MPMKTYAMMVLGCKVNDYEATYVRENMDRHFKEVSFKEKADIYLIFTCCVTNTAEAKTRKFIHDARRNNPDAYIAAIGCLVQIKNKSEVFEDVDLLIGSDEKGRIVELILQGIKLNNVHETVGNDFEHLYIESYPTKSRSFLKIQDGCNQFCSYCIIPYARGRERSGDHLKLIEEAHVLAKKNKELVLTGIHTGRYNDGEYDLYHLLKELCEIDELKTIRLSSIEITEINDDIIRLMAQNDKLAAHLHIPVQSCDNDILRLMNRPYTIEEYMDRIAYIRKMIPDISISTDLIVGFPEEDERRFMNTCKKLQEIGFSFIHVFPYSRKSGTAADRMSGHIDARIKKERVRKVMDLERPLTEEYRKRFTGKKVKVLIERNDDGYSYGYARQYFYVKVKGILETGEIYDVIINEVNDEVIGSVA
ncbi:MAG: tRNA (N(6)-L-threonylcarbamoyladenosine(37)-C(2))-methylthiotransferase MtaB [Erysipelotrichaceae bacterium]|nr:tRNA (N(6)-L-threonylcarbamoyladenosine(37)-C(2))-methylthiotransferase MtaB [Erysipelotrichaceae bacterium]